MVLRLGVSMALFVAALIYEIRSITKSSYPMLRAGVAMATIIPLFLVLFAWIYLTMSRFRSLHVRAPARPDLGALLHRVRVLDRGVRRHHPTHRRGPTGHDLQMLADLAVVAVVVRLILDAARVGLRERPDPDHESREPA